MPRAVYYDNDNDKIIPRLIPITVTRKYTDYPNSYSVPPTTYHYDPLPPPPPFPSTDPSQAAHSPAHWSPASSEHHPSLSTVSHSMSSYYSHPAFLPHARDIREAQVGMQVRREKEGERELERADCFCYRNITTIRYHCRAWGASP